MNLSIRSHTGIIKQKMSDLPTGSLTSFSQSHQSAILKYLVYYRFAFVEFSEAGAVNTALQYNGVIFGGRPLK